MLLADHPTPPCLPLGGRVREHMQGEIVAAGKKQTAKNGHLFRRARLARTGACRSLSQLGNGAANWKKERRADLFPSDQAACRACVCVLCSCAASRVAVQVKR